MESDIKKTIQRERVINRLVMCKKQVAQAKQDIIFWNQQTAQAVEELAKDKQFNFDTYFNKKELIS